MSLNDETSASLAALAGRRVLLGVSGSIAAYKGAEVCRRLVKAGAAVQVVMTEAATRFVGPLTFQALSGRPVARSMFEEAPAGDAMDHISLARAVDLVLVAPATADLVARAASGRADDLLACVLLVTGAPVLLAPAMNPSMWASPLTQANVKRLVEVAGFSVVGPAAGEAACGEEGPGRMEEPATIVTRAASLLGG